MFLFGSYISKMGSAKHECVLCRCIGYFLLTISALKYEKLDKYFILCAAYSGEAKEYFEVLWIVNMARALRSIAGENFLIRKITLLALKLNLVHSLVLSSVWTEYSRLQVLFLLWVFFNIFFFFSVFPLELNVAFFWASIHFCSWDSGCFFRHRLSSVLEIPRFACLLSTKNQSL